MSSLPDKIRNKLKIFIFRRVSRVSNKQLYQTRYYTAPQTYTKIINIADVSKEEVNQNIEFRYRGYYGWSSKIRLRDNDSFLDSSIFFERGSFGVFNPLRLQIEDDSTNERDIAPREGDLVCGIVKSDSLGNLFYEQWFICSEQFYRAWTLMVYDTHSSFTKAEQKECGSKTYWMSGNRLMTNNYLKWILGLKEKDLVPTEEEQKVRYWHQRCEKIARTWIHLYCALVLLIRYNELPTESNVPVIRGSELHSYSYPYPYWHLPDQFIQSFIKMHG